MFKFLAICFLAILANVLAKPHLLTTGVSFATPAVVAPVVAQPVITHPVVAATAVRTPLVAAAGYYPAYTAYASYPHLVRAAHFIRR